MSPVGGNNARRYAYSYPFRSGVTARPRVRTVAGATFVRPRFTYPTEALITAAAYAAAYARCLLKVASSRSGPEKLTCGCRQSHPPSSGTVSAVGLLLTPTQLPGNRWSKAGATVALLPAVALAARSDYQRYERDLLLSRLASSAGESSSRHPQGDASFSE